MAALWLTAKYWKHSSTNSGNEAKAARATSIRRQSDYNYIRCWIATSTLAKGNPQVGSRERQLRLRGGHSRMAENLLCIVGSITVPAVELSRQVPVFRGKSRRGIFRGIAEIRNDQKRWKSAA